MSERLLLISSLSSIKYPLKPKFKLLFILFAVNLDFNYLSFNFSNSIDFPKIIFHIICCKFRFHFFQF